MRSSDQVDATNPVIILWGLKTVNSGSLRYSEVLNLLLIQLFFFFYSFLTSVPRDLHVLHICLSQFLVVKPVTLLLLLCSGLPLSWLTHSTHSQKLILVRPAANFLDSGFLI